MSSDTENLAERAKSIVEAQTDNFAELLRLSGLDPQIHLRCANLSGVDFSGCDLRGFDLTGARLLGCRFDGALIAGARFDQAEIDQAGRARDELCPILASDGSQVMSPDGSPVFASRHPVQRTNLRAARDWAKHVSGWQRPERPVSDAHLRAGAVFQDAPFTPEMVIIPPGEFTMGSPPDEPGSSDAEGPQHPVTIPQSFAAGRFAVTFDEWDFAQGDKQWRKVTGLKPRKPDDQGWGRGDRPVIDVSWDDAQAYVKWLRAKTGREYRLLSEAEWEYAARGGTTTPFWWGASITPGQANYYGNYVYEGGGEKGEYRQKTEPVDQFEPNPFGLYQVHGNVYEWVEDRWHETYKDAPTDGSARTTGDSGLRVLRGGSWGYGPQGLRSATRGRGTPGIRDYGIGFRLSRTLNL